VFWTETLLGPKSVMAFLLIPTFSVREMGITPLPLWEKAGVTESRFSWDVFDYHALT
jgi:hypothetical protein